MEIVELLVPMGLLMGLGFVTAFSFAVLGGQFDDTRTPALRAIEDDNTDDADDLSNELKIKFKPRDGEHNAR